MSAPMTVAAYDLRAAFGARSQTVDYCHMAVDVLTDTTERFKSGIEVDGDALANLRATLPAQSRDHVSNGGAR